MHYNHGYGRNKARTACNKIGWVGCKMLFSWYFLLSGIIMLAASIAGFVVIDLIMEYDFESHDPMYIDFERLLATTSSTLIEYENPTLSREGVGVVETESDSPPLSHEGVVETEYERPPRSHVRVVETEYESLPLNHVGVVETTTPHPAHEGLVETESDSPPLSHEGVVETKYERPPRSHVGVVETEYESLPLNHIGVVETTTPHPAHEGLVETTTFPPKLTTESLYSKLKKCRTETECLDLWDLFASSTLPDIKMEIEIDRPPKRAKKIKRYSYTNESKHGDPHENSLNSLKDTAGNNGSEKRGTGSNGNYGPSHTESLMEFKTSEAKKNFTTMNSNSLIIESEDVLSTTGKKISNIQPVIHEEKKYKNLGDHVEQRYLESPAVKREKVFNSAENTLLSKTAALDAKNRSRGGFFNILSGEMMLQETSFVSTEIERSTNRIFKREPYFKKNWFGKLGPKLLLKPIEVFLEQIGMPFLKKKIETSLRTKLKTLLDEKIKASLKKKEKNLTDEILKGLLEKTNGINDLINELMRQFVDIPIKMIKLIQDLMLENFKNVPSVEDFKNFINKLDALVDVQNEIENIGNTLLEEKIKTLVKEKDGVTNGVIDELGNTSLKFEKVIHIFILLVMVLASSVLHLVVAILLCPCKSKIKRRCCCCCSR